VRIFQGPMPLAWLPNQAGFKFKGILKTGHVQVCVVQRNKYTGLHYVRGVRYELLTGWRYIDE